jgi:hypothetical protein
VERCILLSASSMARLMAGFTKLPIGSVIPGERWVTARNVG